MNNSTLNDIARHFCMSNIPGATIPATRLSNILNSQTIDSDLRSIFLRADKTRREAIKAFLLAEDPNRYRWLNDNRFG